MLPSQIGAGIFYTTPDTMPSNMQASIGPPVMQQQPNSGALPCPPLLHQQPSALGKQPSNAQAILQAIRALAEASEVLQGIDQQDAGLAYGSPHQPGQSSMQLMRQQVHQQMQTLMELLPGHEPLAAAPASSSFIPDPPGLQQAPAFFATLDDSLELLSAVAPADSCAVPIAASSCLGVSANFSGATWHNPGASSWQAANSDVGPLQLLPQPHQAPGVGVGLTALLAPQPSMGSWSSCSSIGPFVRSSGSFASIGLLEAAANGGSQLTDSTAHYSDSTDARTRPLARTTSGFASAAGGWPGPAAAVAAAQRRSIGDQGWPWHSLPNDARGSSDTYNNRSLPDARDRRSSLPMGEGVPGRIDAQPPPPKAPPAAAGNAAGKTDGGDTGTPVPAIKGTGMWLPASVRAAAASQASVRCAATPQATSGSE